MFGSNNYLGLTLHPEVSRRRARAVLEYGTGTTGSRTANGTLAHPRRARARVRRLVRQAPRHHLQHRLPGQPVADRRPVRRRRRHPDRRRQPRQHLRRDAADGGAGHRLPAQLAREPAQEARAAAGGPAQPAGRRRRAVFDSRRRGAAARDRRRLPRARRLPAGRRGAFARHLRTDRPRLRRGSGRPRPRSTSSSARSRSRWPASAASACRTIPSCARCISSRAPTSSPRRDRRRTSPACSAAVSVVRAHPELRDQLWANVRRLRAGAARAAATRSATTESPIVPILTGDEAAHDRALAGAAERRAVREPDRAARLPGRRVRAARQLLGRAHARADHARARHLRARRRRIGVTRRRKRECQQTSTIQPAPLDTTRPCRPSPSRKSICATMPRRSRSRSTRQTNPSAASSA